MFFDCVIRLKNMDICTPVAVSDVCDVENFVPISNRANKAVDWFRAVSVVVSYSGDLMKSGHVKRRFVFNPKYEIGFVGYNVRKGVTDIQYLFDIANYVCPEDAYYAASMFASVMFCRVRKASRQNG